MKAVREERLFADAFWRQQIGILTLARVLLEIAQLHKAFFNKGVST
jgi:hypothetical protein